MDNQTKINILSLAIDRITEYSNGNIPDTVLIKNLNIIKQELEQSNNKDNIDNWSNRELFDYCVENDLIVHRIFEFWDDNWGKNIMIKIINHYKANL